MTTMATCVESTKTQHPDLAEEPTDPDEQLTTAACGDLVIPPELLAHPELKAHEHVILAGLRKRIIGLPTLNDAERVSYLGTVVMQLQTLLGKDRFERLLQTCPEGED